MKFLLNENNLLNSIKVITENKYAINISESDMIFNNKGKQLVFSRKDLAGFELFADDLISGLRKTFNVQFITQIDDSVDNDVVTMYQMSIDHQTRVALSQATNKTESLLEAISLKSNDFKEMLKNNDCIRFVKLNEVRIYEGKIGKGQSDRFSIIFKAYPKNTEVKE